MAESIDATAGKTPVSLLQELFVKKGIVPKYDLVQIEGAIHEPTFKYRVSVGDVVAMGSGQSKKKAKHAAAKAILDKILGTQEFDLELSGVVQSPQVLSPYEDGIPGNPVGNLQELCIAHRWSPPTYILAGENGLPHDREFVITCVVDTYKELGAGKSKKLAKRQAAYKMLLRLRDTPIELPSTGCFEDDDEIAQRACNKQAGLKDPQHKSSQGMKVTQYHRSLKKLTSHCITALQTLSLDDKTLNTKKLVDDIAKEENFEATYVDIEETSHSGKHQCLLTLSTTPMAVFYGSGSSYAEAQLQSAMCALQYLKLMTKVTPLTVTPPT